MCLEQYLEHTQYVLSKCWPFLFFLQNKFLKGIHVVVVLVITKSGLTLLQSHGLQLASFHLWDFPGKNTGVGCHFLLQLTFLTQKWNPCLLHWQADSLPLSHQGSPKRYTCIFQILIEIAKWCFQKPASLYYSKHSETVFLHSLCHRNENISEPIAIYFVKNEIFLCTSIFSNPGKLKTMRDGYVFLWRYFLKSLAHSRLSNYILCKIRMM